VARCSLSSRRYRGDADKQAVGAERCPNLCPPQLVAHAAAVAAAAAETRTGTTGEKRMG